MTKREQELLNKGIISNEEMEELNELEYEDCGQSGIYPDCAPYVFTVDGEEYEVHLPYTRA